MGLFHKRHADNIPQHCGFERTGKPTNQAVSNKEIQNNVSCELAHKWPVWRTLLVIHIPEVRELLLLLCLLLRIWSCRISVTGDSVLSTGCSAAEIPKSRMLHRHKPQLSYLQQKHEGGHCGRVGKRQSWDSGT